MGWRDSNESDYELPEGPYKSIEKKENINIDEDRNEMLTLSMERPKMNLFFVLLVLLVLCSQIYIIIILGQNIKSFNLDNNTNSDKYMLSSDIKEYMTRRDKLLDKMTSEAREQNKKLKEIYNLIGTGATPKPVIDWLIQIETNIYNLNREINDIKTSLNNKSGDKTNTGSNEKSKIYIHVQPENAEIKILNIKPKFNQGMVLNPDKIFKFNISAEGYQTKKISHTFYPGSNIMFVDLIKRND